MATRPEPRLTYDDYVRFPDGQRWELLDGEALVTPSPTTRHQRIVQRLLRMIEAHLDDAGGGEVFVAPLDVVLGPHDVVQPDIVYVADNDAHIITDANIRGAPTWLVEILSDPIRDRRLKRQRYADFGIREYWIVDPDDDLLEVHHLRDGVYPDPLVLRPPDTATPIALPGLAIDLARLLDR